MPRISITKKTAWSLILKINEDTPHVRKNILTINEKIDKNNILYPMILKII